MRNVFKLVVPMLIALPSLAFAQDGEEAPPDAKPADATEAKPEEKPAKAPDAAAAVDPDADRPFQIKRGLHAEADLGVYFTFGGRNTNDPNLQYPGKTISNVQPYLGVFFGYDVIQAPKYAFAVGLKFAAGYSGGAGRVSASEVQVGSTMTGERSNDFGIMQVGAGLAFDYLVNDRLAVTVKADGGLAALDPDPSRFAADPAAGGATIGGIVGGGLGIEYFTLLNDFSVGFDARFAMVFGGGGSIPSMSLTVPVKYTF